MKKYAGMLCLVFLLAPAIMGAPKNECPSDQAAREGYDPFAAFHEVIAPAWHKAWTEKDFAALFAAGPKFVDALAGITTLKPVLKSSAREAAFTEHRNELAHQVKLYAEAARVNDSNAVYEILPKLHEAFEQTASALAPVQFPAFDDMAATVGVILKTYLPKDDAEGVAAWTDTLLNKINGLTPESLPDELKSDQEKVMADLGTMRVLGGKMKACIDEQDMTGYREHITALDGAIRNFREKYI